MRDEDDDDEGEDDDGEDEDGDEEGDGDDGGRDGAPIDGGSTNFFPRAQSPPPERSPTLRVGQNTALHFKTDTS